MSYTDAGGVGRHTLHTAQFNLQPGQQTAELRLWWQANSSGTCGGELAGDIVLLPVPPARVWIKRIVENVSLLKVACQSPSSSPSVGNSVALYTVHSPQICLEAQEIFLPDIQEICPMLWEHLSRSAGNSAPLYTVPSLPPPSPHPIVLVQENIFALYICPHSIGDFVPRNRNVCPIVAAPPSK